MAAISLDSNKGHNKTSSNLKFLCSYGGKIFPRHPDRKLRYVGGDTRVLAADPSVTFAELLGKMSELCGSPVSLRCQLPNVDLDTLVSITSDEELAMLVGEYNRASQASTAPLKIRAFLSVPKSVGKGKTMLPSSPPSSATTSSSRSSTSSVSDSSSGKSFAAGVRCRATVATCSAASRRVSPTLTPTANSVLVQKYSAGSKLQCRACAIQGSAQRICGVQYKNHCPMAMPVILPQYSISSFYISI